MSKKHVQVVSHTINGADCCGNINPSYFRIDINFFLEAQKFNTCLNKKISIDINGEIKNCPSINESFGHIDKISLHEAITKSTFKELWNINKDQISICKDCEFRYICSDCRAYINDENNIYSKPSKCLYDPYTATYKS